MNRATSYIAATLGALLIGGFFAFLAVLAFHSGSIRKGVLMVLVAIGGSAESFRQTLKYNLKDDPNRYFNDDF